MKNKSQWVERGEEEIHNAYEELWEKIWWNRHQERLHRIETGTETVTGELVRILEEAKIVARRIELKYGRENLGWDDVEWGIIYGKLLALAWLNGDEWNQPRFDVNHKNSIRTDNRVCNLEWCSPRQNGAAQQAARFSREKQTTSE